MSLDTEYLLRQKHIGSLTSIRGIAAWWVVVFHFREALPVAMPSSLLRLADHGYLAVDLFFPLSGFVIGLNYADKLASLNFSSYIKFLWLRIARVYPLHFVMLILYLTNPLAIYLFSNQRNISGRYDTLYFLLSLLLMQNWGLTDHLQWNVPAWSISTEWMAYLLVPLLLVGQRFSKHCLLSAFVEAVFPLAGLAALASAFHCSLSSDITHFGAARCVLEFWSGLCLLKIYRLRLNVAWVDGAVAAVGSLLCFILYIYLGWPDYTSVPLGFLFLIYALCRCGGYVRRAMNSDTILYIGTISYSTYLIHYFIRDWVKFLMVEPDHPTSSAFGVYLIVTACLSPLFYHFIEVPGRTLLRRHAF